MTTTQHAQNAGEWLTKLIDSPAFVGSLLGALVASLGFYIAYRQLRNAGARHEEEMTWRRSEFVRKLLTDMFNDQQVALIFRILDWRDGPALIPENLRPFFKEQSTGEGEPPRIMRINWDRFVSALPIIKNDNWEEPDLYTYRTCFDSFLSFIQQTAVDLRASGIEKKMFADLTFYCYRVVNPRNGKRDPDGEAKKVFERYIREYYNRETYEYIEECAKFYEETFVEKTDVEVEYRAEMAESLTDSQ